MSLLFAIIGIIVWLGAGSGFCMNGNAECEPESTYDADCAWDLAPGASVCYIIIPS